MEAATIDHIRAGAFGRLYKPDNVLTGSTGAGNNWAKGTYVRGCMLLGVAGVNVGGLVCSPFFHCPCLWGY
jgi:tubulin beta